MHGFSLLEFLIYLGVSSIICMLLCNWVAYSVCAMNKISQQNSIDLTLLCVIDCCARDIYAAPTNSSAWIKQEPQYVLWVQGNMVIGYHYDKKHIMRVAGHYDPISKTFVGKLKRSKIASHVTQCQFEIQKEQKKIIGVCIECAIQKGETRSNTKGECTHYIAIQNS